MIARIDRGIGKFNSLGNVEIELSSQLRLEQRKAVDFVLRSRDLAVNIHGAAGTGKTATLQELHRALNESGREVVAVAPTMSAVEELQKVGFNDAMTIQRLLQDERAHTNLSDKVIIADEAGMISGRQMSDLLKLTEDQGARLVFSGDTRQIRSVESTDALRLLEKESGLKSVSLTQVQRQSSAEYREAVQELRRDPEQGIAKLDGMEQFERFLGKIAPRRSRRHTQTQIWSSTRKDRTRMSWLSLRHTTTSSKLRRRFAENARDQASWGPVLK
jgi:ATP-dependent exoDNAse (exonuclease V) alpha subunit